MRISIGYKTILPGVALIATTIATVSVLLGWWQSFIIAITGSIPLELAVQRNRWDLTLAAILLFIAFLALIPVRIKASWSSHGIYTAFMVALFAEMFGFPLTIYFLSSYLGFLTFEVDFMSYMFRFGMLVGSPITTVGILLVVLGWREIYRAKGRLVTTGIYAHIRHPQYLGILLVTLGWLIHWPAAPTALMWPILALLYYRLAKGEERTLIEVFGEEYEQYMSKTGFMLPPRLALAGLRLKPQRP